MTHATQRAFPFTQRCPLRPPYEYETLRAEEPLAPVTLADGTPALAVTRYQDVREVLSDPRFSREAFAGRDMVARPRESLPLAAADPPDHSRRREAVAHSFTARKTELMRPELTRIAREKLARMRAAGPPADLVTAFARPFPLAVMCRILGAPFDDWRVFQPWVDAMTSTSGHVPEEVADANRRLREHVSELIDRKRAAPGDDSAHDLIIDLCQDATLSPAEVVALVAGLLIAGYETTSNQLTICVHLLLSDPELAGRLRRDPALVPDAVEEMLRWTPFVATGGPPMVATRDVPLAGSVVRAGQVVVPVFESANHDPAVFADPDRILLGRSSNAHVALGYGRHHCLGAHLARAELGVALELLLTEFDDLRSAVTADKLRWRHGMFLRGLWELPVTWNRTNHNNSTSERTS